MNKLIFLCLSIAIVLLSVIVLNLAPGLNSLLTYFSYNSACQYYADLYKYREKKSLTELQVLGVSLTDNDDRKEYLDLIKEGKNKCYRDKAMIGLEFAAFNINVVFGATCSILGLLFYLAVPNVKGKIVGLIGLITGIVGFVLTFVYIIETGIIITSDVEKKGYSSLSLIYSNAEPKIDADGAYLKWDEGKKSYVCIYYDKDNKDSLYRKFSHNGNKYLSYLTKVKYAKEEKNYEYMSNGGCVFDIFSSLTTMNNFWKYCKELDNKEHQSSKSKYYDDTLTEKGDCEKLFYLNPNADNTKINDYNKVVTAYIFSVLISVLHIGLIIFGFLLFKDSGDSSSGPVSIK